ncbi:MAG: hypothetical protein LUQ52_06235 [Methylococcaceae bacterium]|nr:hypothetical protein [Methylococcaceae bacterium]
MRSTLLFVPALMLFSFSSFAEVPLSQADILGTWQIDKESLQSDGSKSRSLNSTWTFKNDGTMDGVSQDSDAHARTETLRKWFLNAKPFTFLCLKNKHGRIYSFAINYKSKTIMGLYLGIV